MENFCKKYNVSRETFLKLEMFVTMLEEWQTRLNLVSKNSLPQVWERHIADSAQLFKFMPEKASLVYDLGTGAGFPGMVLAIMAQEKRPQTKFVLIESIAKKTVYLNDVKRKLGLTNVTVINDRSENLRMKPADVVTARAVSALDKLLNMVYPLCSPETRLILPKGKSFPDELKAAQTKWNFQMTVEKNELTEDGVILLLRNLRRKKP